MRTVWAVALCLALLVGCTGGSGNGPNPSDMVGSWKLIDLQGFNGTAHTAPDNVLTLRFTPGWVGNCFASTRVTVGVGSLHFPPEQNWVSRLPTGCPHLGAQQAQFVYHQVLTGTTSWEIRADELTLSRDGAAAVFQHLGAN